MIQELKSFFETNDLAIRAAESIRNGREISLKIKIGDAVQSYVFTKEGGRNLLRSGESSSADLTFSMPEAAARSLVTQNFESVGQVGLHIFEKMLSNDSAEKIHVKIHSGVLSLVTGGYLGVLTAGGTDVAKFLASKGLGSLGKIKDTISKMRG